MAGGTSRRRYRRMTLRIEVEYDAQGSTRKGIATTLGAGGLFIASDEPLEEGTLLVARFRLPRGETLHQVAGRVAWTHRREDHPNTSPGMGIAFADPANGALLACELEALDAAGGGEATREPRSAGTD
jgi:type IV pilus assembly protein PilZ